MTPRWISNRGKSRMRLAVALLGMAAGASRGSAQSLSDEPPEYTPDMLYPRVKYIKLDAEAESTSSKQVSGGSTSTSRLYLAPVAGIEWNYFIYHPNLLTYTLLAEPGYVWQQTGSPGSTSQESSLLLNGNLNVSLLRAKPYATTFFASADHDTYNYDFFNTAVVDSHMWGVTSGYSEGPVPVTVSYQNTAQDSTGFLQSSTSDQDTLNFHARNERKSGDVTDLTYLYGDYSQTTTSTAPGGGSGVPQSFADTSDYQYVTLTDAEQFRRSDLNSTLLFNQVDTTGSSSEDLNLSEDYGRQLSPHLRNSDNYSLSYYSSEGADSIQNSGRVGLQHQLYESLASSADVHGSELDTSSFGSSLDSTTGGTALSEDYTKHLGAWGNLSISDSGGYDLTMQSSSGQALLVPNESHVLTLGQWVRLAQPQDIALINVTTDALQGFKTLTEGVDFIVDRSQNPWQIQILPFSSLVHSGDTVLINYTVQPNPSGNYSVLNDQFQIRLDFWNNHAGIYARYNFTDNHASSPAFVLENINEFQTGADASWCGFRVSANYDDRESSLYHVQSVGLSEGYSMLLSSHSTAGVSLGQNWSFYPGGGTNATQLVSDFNYTAHYDWHLDSRLTWSSEAGYDEQRGNGLNQNVLGARTYLNWKIGKLELHLGYEFQNQDYQSQTRERNYVFLRAKRTF